MASALPTSTFHQRRRPAPADHADQHRWRCLPVGRLRLRQPRRLVPAVTHVSDAAAIAAKDLQQPFASIDFDFHLYPETAAAPTSQIERNRAAA